MPVYLERGNEIPRYAEPLVNTVTTVMTYGADVGGMLASLVALATLCLSLRRPRGKHHRGRRR